jgi:hypothetical protein
MTLKERKKLHEEIKEALKNCPPGHPVILGHDGMPSIVETIRFPRKTYGESLGMGSWVIYTGRYAKRFTEETKRRRR